jgi:protein-tyrosine-phosphatase
MINSPLFTSKQFSEEYNSRFDLILELDRRGYSTVQIRDFLNTNRIRPSRTDLFSTKLVWTTLKKLKERKKFRETFVRQISEVTVVVYSLKEP